MSVTIPIYEYNELVRASEQIATVERYIKANKYINTGDIIAILNIKQNSTP